jgi:DNA-binding MurR/RpiR family transcriptional regulator
VAGDRAHVAFGHLGLQELRQDRDGSGGFVIHMAKVARPQDLLLAVSFQFYATEVVNIVEQSTARAAANE